MHLQKALVFSNLKCGKWEIFHIEDASRDLDAIFNNSKSKSLLNGFLVSTEGVVTIEK